MYNNLILLSLLIFSQSAFAKPATVHKFAVLDLQPGRDVDQAVTKGLSELAMAEIQGRHLGECIGSSDIKSMLNLEQSKQLMGCADDASCVAEIGGALGVDLLFAGGITRIGSKYLVSLKLFNVSQAKVLARLSESVDADEDALLQAFPDMIGRLFAHSDLAQNANTIKDLQLGEGACQLVVRSDPGGSDVFLAGRQVGQTPLLLEKIPAGRYQLQVQHRDYATFQQVVSLDEDEKRIVEAKLNINPELAWRNYEFAQQRYKKQADSNSFWGLTHTIAGSMLGGLGLVGVAIGSQNKNPLVGMIPGAIVSALGVGWAAIGVIKLLNPPEAPEKPKEAQPKTDVEKTSPAS